MERFKPKDPDFERRLRDSYRRNPMMATLGATFERIDPGYVDMAMPFRKELCQQHGYLHAGVTTTLLDTASGYAGLSLMPPGAAVLAVEFKVNFMAPAIGDRLVAFGRVIKSGRTLTVCAGDAYACTGESRKLVATLQSTVMAVTGRDITD